MIRITKALAVAAVAVMTLPSIASALGISIVRVSGEGAGGVLLPGQTVTFDLVLDNTSPNEEVLGLGVNVTGYDPVADLDSRHDGNLEFQSGQAVSDVLGNFVPGPDIIVDSLSRVPGSAPVENYFVSQFDPQAYTTSLWVGANAFDTVNGPGGDDLGLGGNPVSTGDIHFQVTFVAAPVSSQVQLISVDFGLDAVGAGGVVLPTTGDSFGLRVIPEPGTALLMGLGLAGLAARRR